MTRLALDVLWGVPSIVYGAFGFILMLWLGVRASLLGGISGVFGVELYAITGLPDDIAAGRRYELQGRLREALSLYARTTDSESSPRARLAEGALKLRMGNIEGAQTSLRDAAACSDDVISSAALALLGEAEAARKARMLLAAERLTAKTPADWYQLGIYEVRAYEFRAAANSFMKAANSAPEDDKLLQYEARFRSAWCQKEVGQISTAVYGFRSLADDMDDGSELAYTASILEAVSLSRVGRYEESVAVCRDLLRTSAPDNGRQLEALTYFHKGCIELKHLNSFNAASESLGRVAAAGQGNLSFAAQHLLQSHGR